MMKVRPMYFPQAFAPETLEHAKDIILSSDPSGEKWIHETEFTVKQLIQAFAQAGRPLDDNSVVLDYGCGIGRIAKRLIELTNCTVVGADISPQMLAYSIPYVNSPNFVICPQPSLGKLASSGQRFTGAYSVWTLQHCLDPSEDIAAIHGTLAENGLLYIVNMKERYVPVVHEHRGPVFHDDKIDILKLLSDRFRVRECLPFPSDSPSAYSRLLEKLP